MNKYRKAKCCANCLHSVKSFYTLKYGCNIDATCPVIVIDVYRGNNLPYKETEQAKWFESHDLEFGGSGICNKFKYDTRNTWFDIRYKKQKGANE